MATELPKKDGQFYNACRACPAQVRVEGRYICDESQLDEFSGNRKVSRYRPMACPKTTLPITIALTPSSSILKTQLQNLGKK